jgi:hypothetical protein
MLELPRVGRPKLWLALTVDVAGGSEQLTGTITEGGMPFARIVADRGLGITMGNPIAPLTKLPAFLPGNFTAVFAAKTPDEQGLPAAVFPQGDGFASFKVRRDGVVRVTGRLADGTLFNYVNALSKAHRLPLFIRTDARRGSVSGWIQFPHDRSGRAFPNRRSPLVQSRRVPRCIPMAGRKAFAWISPHRVFLL